MIDTTAMLARMAPIPRRFWWFCVWPCLWFAPALSAELATAVDATQQTITLALSSEPPQLDSTQATDQISGMILGHVMEGLLRYGTNNRLQPAVAESYRLTEQGVHFKLRPQARWSDGVPVTAHDFVFAWRKALDPATASQYAFILYPIKNAEAINKGELPPEMLGVTAIDDHNLQVRYRGIEPHFLKLVAFQTYLPVREDFYHRQAGRYGADADTLLYNGPFVITKWVHGARLTLGRNRHYWQQDDIQLRKIDWAYFTSDQNAILNLFRDGVIASANLTAESLEIALQERWRMQRFADGTLFYLSFNYRPNRPTNEFHLRRAMHLVFDPYELVNQVIGLPGYLPGLSLFPAWLQGVRLSFRTEYPALDHQPDEALALTHLAKAKAALGVDVMPPLSLLVGDSASARKEAEYFQNLFQRKLGLKINIDAQIFKQRLAKMTTGDYDLVGAGWGPDYDDPLTFGDLFTSWNKNNRGRYVNPALDRQVRIAENSRDAEVRMRAFAEVQRIIYEDTVVIPTYERGIVYVIHPQLRGAVRRVVGASQDYTRAWVAPPTEAQAVAAP